MHLGDLRLLLVVQRGDEAVAHIYVQNRVLRLVHVRQLVPGAAEAPFWWALATGSAVDDAAQRSKSAQRFGRL